MERQDGSELKASWCRAEEVSTKLKSRSDRLGLRGMRAGPRTAAGRRVWPPPSLGSACWADQEESCFWHTEGTMQKPLRRNSCCPDSATHGWEERPPAQDGARRARRCRDGPDLREPQHTSATWMSGQKRQASKGPRWLSAQTAEGEEKKKEIPTSEARGGEVM